MLSVQLTMDKHQGCTQTMEYSGCLFDTSCGLMQCTEEKLVLLLTHTAVFSSPDLAWSTCNLDRV
jgi:hypothetical protein